MKIELSRDDVEEAIRQYVEKEYSINLKYGDIYDSLNAKTFYGGLIIEVKRKEDD